MGKSLNFKSAVAAACVAMLAGIASAQAAISSFDPALENTLNAVDADYNPNARSLLNIKRSSKKHHKAGKASPPPPGEPAPMPAPPMDAEDGASDSATPPAPTDVEDTASDGQCPSLLELVGEQEDLKVLYFAVQATDLAAAVSDDSAALTILAPVDTAFLAIPREDLEQLVSSRDILTQLLSVHVIEGTVKAADLTDGMEVETLAGVTLTVSLDSGVTFTAEGGTSASVTEADLMSCAGVVHKLDNVLVPGVPIVESVPEEMPSVPTPAPTTPATPPKEEMPTTPPTPTTTPMPTPTTLPMPAPTTPAPQAPPSMPAPTPPTPATPPKEDMPATPAVPTPTTPAVPPKDDMPVAPMPDADKPMAPAPGGAVAEDCGSIVDVLEGAGDLNGLVQALDAASLTATFADPEAMVTVLAPTDEAFGMIPEQDLMNLLNNPPALGVILGLHVLPAAYKAADFAEIAEVTTLANLTLTVAVADGKVSFTAPDGGSTVYVSEADLMSCEGVVHKINGVLVPGVMPRPSDPEAMPPMEVPMAPEAPTPTPAPEMPTPTPEMPAPMPNTTETPTPAPTDELPEDCGSLADVATEAGDLSILLSALEMAGKTEPLTQPDAVLTVLAPNDAAFQSIPGDILQALLDDMTGALAYILDLHVIEGTVKAADLTDGQQITTIGGEMLTVTVADGIVTFQGPYEGGTANVIEADLMSCKGVIHKIDAVLHPGVPDMPTPTTTPTPAATPTPAPTPAPTPTSTPTPPREEPTPPPPTPPPTPPAPPSGTSGGSCNDPMVQDMIAATQAERSKAGLGPQTCNEAGAQACMKWSEKQCGDGSLSHDLQTNMNAAGWSTGAENVLQNNGMDQTVSVGIKQWMESPGHNRNIMRDFDEIACGWATCGRGEQVYWTCIYGQ